MRTGKDLAVLIVACAVAFAVPGTAAAQQRPEPQGPHSDNMRLMGASLRPGAVTGPPPGPARARCRGTRVTPTSLSGATG
jgi:hypothetical protein